MRKMRVSNKEMELIREAINEKNLDYNLKTQHNKLYLEGSEDFFVNCREACLDLLDYKGFDDKYELTPDGYVLEGLVDKIYDLIR